MLIIVVRKFCCQVLWEIKLGECWGRLEVIMIVRTEDWGPMLSLPHWGRGWNILSPASDTPSWRAGIALLLGLSQGTTVTVKTPQWPPVNWSFLIADILALKMSESEGICWRLGLTTVLFGVTFILSMGVVSVQYPHRPPPMGLTVCGEPPEISKPLDSKYGGKMKMEIHYSCPEDFRLEGISSSIMSSEHVIKPSRSIRHFSLYWLYFCRNKSWLSLMMIWSAGPDKLICKKKSKKWVSGSSGVSQCVEVEK